MNWDKGYSASYYMAVVDPITWNDIDRIPITGGTVKRNTEGFRQTADITCVNYPQNVEKYVRIYQDVKQSGEGAHTPLFTGLATSPDRNIKGSWQENNIQCYSVLKAADDIFLPKGWYAPTDISCSSLIKQLMAPIPAPIEFEDTSRSLDSVIIAESGETNFTMLERIVEAMNWDMRIYGDGRIRFCEYSKESVITFDPFEFDMLETSIQIKADWYSCPNVFMADTNAGTVVVKDEDSDTPMSIQNRGREVWMYESGVVLNNGVSPEDYARRRLIEEQKKLITASYDRRFVPDVIPGDIITLHYPKQSIDGNYLIESQSINLGHNARTSENVIGIS